MREENSIKGKGLEGLMRLEGENGIIIIIWDEKMSCETTKLLEIVTGNAFIVIGWQTNLFKGAIESKWIFVCVKVRWQ